MRNIQRTVVLFFAVSCLLTCSLYGQTAQPAATAQPAPKETAKLPVRKLAPNVFYKIDPFREYGKVFERHDVAELLAVDSNFEFAKDVSFHRDIWYLEFEFKPMRMVDVDIPQPNGQMMRKKVWYLVYKVKNPGKAYHAVKNDAASTTDANVTSETAPYRPLTTYQADEAYKVVEMDDPISFAPYFSLECTVKEKDKSGNYKEDVKKYRERFIPLAVDVIRHREDPGRKFLTSIEMCRTIKPGEEYWGVATWVDVDKTTTKFSICVNGLTNAYHWKDAESASASEIWKKREFEYKVLKLNFWRPADEFYETDNDIIYGQNGEEDYSWIYRPLGT